MMNQSDLMEIGAGYRKAFPNYPPLIAWRSPKKKGGQHRCWLYGYWEIGNDYKGSGYHGSYPPSFLKRIYSMFPEKDYPRMLHLFSGSLQKEERGIRFDINPKLKPDVCGEAEKLWNYFTKKFNLIIADPPYTEEDALKYGNPMVSRNKVVKECVKSLRKGGILVWLDMVKPMYRKDELNHIGSIGLARSTNHRVRSVFIYEKI